MPRIVNWYTNGSPYEAVAKISAKTFGLAGAESESYGIEGVGDWVQNCALKPKVCQSLLKTLKPNEGLILLDADAEVLQAFPWKVLEQNNGPYFAYVLHNRPSGAREVLSGTLWITATPECHLLLTRWAEACETHPNDWDQKVLAAIIGSTPPRLRGKLDEQQIAELDWHWAWLAGISDPNLEKQAYIRHNQMSRETRPIEEKKKKK